MSVRWNKRLAVEDGREVVVLGGVLQLRSVRHLPRFLKWNRGIQRQLATSEGLLRYSLRARMRTLEFEALSVWTDHAPLASFARGGAHASAARDLKHAGAMASSRFVSWDHTTGKPWPTWEDLAVRMRFESDDRPGGSPVTLAGARGVPDSG